jgi:hypothetical protein
MGTDPTRIVHQNLEKGGKHEHSETNPGRINLKRGCIGAWNDSDVPSAQAA